MFVNASYLFKCLVCSARPEAALSLDFFPIKSVITSTITMIPDSGANVIMASLILQIKFLPS